MKNWKERVRVLARKGLGQLYQWIRVLGQILYGMTIYDSVRGFKKERGQIERLFILFTFSDLLGIPLFPPYYSLSLLPYIMPKLNVWKGSMLRARDLTDLCDQDVG